MKTVSVLFLHGVDWWTRSLPTLCVSLGSVECLDVGLRPEGVDLSSRTSSLIMNKKDGDFKTPVNRPSISNDCIIRSKIRSFVVLCLTFCFVFFFMRNGSF